MGSAGTSTPRPKRVVVTADSTVSAGEVADTSSARPAPTRAPSGSSGRPGCCVPSCRPAMRSTARRYRCSLGFNVVKGSTYYFLTAGHCGKSEKNWYTSSSRSTLIGPTTGYSFPGNDYALVRYDNLSLSHPGGFSVADAYVGERVTRDGSTTGVHSGTVTGAQRDGPLPGRRHGVRAHQDQRLRRARGLGRPALRRHAGRWGSRPAAAATAGPEGRPTSSPSARP